MNDFEAGISSVNASSEHMMKGSDEGLTLEMSAFSIFHGSNSTLNLFDKTKFLFHSPTDAVAQFL